MFELTRYIKHLQESNEHPVLFVSNKQEAQSGTCHSSKVTGTYHKLSGLAVNAAWIIVCSLRRVCKLRSQCCNRKNGSRRRNSNPMKRYEVLEKYLNFLLAILDLLQSWRILSSFFLLFSMRSFNAGYRPLPVPYMSLCFSPRSWVSQATHVRCILRFINFDFLSSFDCEL